MAKEMIVILLKSGQHFCYDPEEYNDYECNKKLFIVKRNEQWIGMYNIDAIEYIRIDRV